MPRTFNLGDLLDVVAQAVPETLAVVAGDARLTFHALNERVDHIAAALKRRGIARGETVGLMMYNGPEILVSFFACCKLGAIPFNVNYRYEPNELRQILEDANAAVLLVSSPCLDTVRKLPPGTPGLGHLIVAYDPGVPRAPDTESFADLLAEPVGDTDIATGRSDDDRLLIYTGGTTGLPKGVEWSHRNFFYGAAGGGALMPGSEPVKKPEELGERAPDAMPMALLSLLPLIHGAGLYSALSILFAGQRMVNYTERSFNGEKAWDLADREGVSNVSFAGNAMGLPLLEAYDANPGRWKFESLFALSWGGGALSENLQAAFRERFPHVYFINGLGSSESGTVGQGMPALNGEGLMRLAPGSHLNVIVDGQREAEIGETGVLARSGALPNGYWRHPEKTAETFVTVNGTRYVLIGDLARRDADGNLTVFGREATCINTGGEKVFAEEVDAVIRSHPEVLDALVMGAPHERWGQIVVAFVTLRGGSVLTLEALQTHCRGQLAGYKLPKQLVVLDAIKRSPAGKPDYRWAREQLARG